MKRDPEIPWVERLLRDCVPAHGHSSPAEIGDGIRNWIADQGCPTSIAAPADGGTRPRLYQHEDGRFGLAFEPARFAAGVPAWHAVPIDVLELPQSPATANTTTEAR
ncbi:hypothetical protein ACVCMJ_09585 [Castellaniella sp. UC4447_H14]